MIHSLILSASELYPDSSEVSVLKRFMENHVYDMFSELKNDFARMCARVYSYDKLDLQYSINVVINTTSSILVHKYYGSGLTKHYVYHHSRFIISHFDFNFPTKYKNPMDELNKVWCEQIGDIEATKKMLRLLVGFSQKT